MQSNKATEAETVVRELRASRQQLQSQFEDEKVRRCIASPLSCSPRAAHLCSQKNQTVLSLEMGRQYKDMRRLLSQKVAHVEEQLRAKNDELLRAKEAREELQRRHAAELAIKVIAPQRSSSISIGNHANHVMSSM